MTICVNCTRPFNVGERCMQCQRDRCIELEKAAELRGEKRERARIRKVQRGEANLARETILRGPMYSLPGCAAVLNAIRAMMEYTRAPRAKRGGRTT